MTTSLNLPVIMYISTILCIAFIAFVNGWTIYEDGVSNKTGQESERVTPSPVERDPDDPIFMVTLNHVIAMRNHYMIVKSITLVLSQVVLGDEEYYVSFITKDGLKCVARWTEAPWSPGNPIEAEIACPCSN